MADETHGRHTYYERLYALVALAELAPTTAGFSSDEPASEDEKRLGAAIGQALHQGCSLADIALAADLPPDQIVEIGKRTIRRTNWVKRL